STAGGLVRVDDKTDDVVFSNQSYTTPLAWFRSDGSAKVTATALVQKAPVEMSDVEVTRHEATSKDGTKIPYSAFALKNAIANAKGAAPVWLTGYGGFGVDESPVFRVGTRAWIEQGGAVVVATLRGGGEFGE